MVFHQKEGSAAKHSQANQKVPMKKLFKGVGLVHDEDYSDMEDSDSGDDSDSGGADVRMNAKGKLQPTPGKGTPLIKTPKCQAQTPAQLSNKKKQQLAASPFQKAGKQKQSPGAKEQNRQVIQIDSEEESSEENNSDSGDVKMSPKEKQTPTHSKGRSTPKGLPQTPMPTSAKKVFGSPQAQGKQHTMKETPGIKGSGTSKNKTGDRHSRTLYLGRLPLGTESDDLKALSSDIISVSMPQRQKKKKTNYGFIEFENEKKAEENLAKLQKKKIHGQEFVVDFVGAKSSNQRVVSKSEMDEQNILKTKLVILGLPADTTMGDVAQLFPKCYTILLNNDPNFRTASALFHTEEDGIEAFKANQNAKIKGRSVNVEFASTKSRKNKRGRHGVKNVPSKKQRCK